MKDTRPEIYCGDIKLSHELSDAVMENLSEQLKAMNPAYMNFGIAALNYLLSGLKPKRKHKKPSEIIRAHKTI